MDHETLQLIFIGIAAFALLTQTLIMILVFAGMAKGLKAMKEQVDEVKSEVMPLLASAKPILETARQTLESTRQTWTRVSPKVEATFTDISEVVHAVRNQTQNAEASFEQILTRVNKQSSRIDTMFSGTLDAVDKAGGYVAKVVQKPARQLSGLMAGLKAMVETLGSPAPRYPVTSVSKTADAYDHAPSEDKDLFV